MKLEPATLTWKDPSCDQIHTCTRYLHRLIPVVLCGSEALGAKVCDAVDKVVEVPKIGRNLRNNLEAVGSH